MRQGGGDGSGGSAYVAWSSDRTDWYVLVQMRINPSCIIHTTHTQQRDDLEDEELQANQMTETMATTTAGFKDHPLYALRARAPLKHDEVVEPPIELGKFCGESVYPSPNVLQLKTAENCMARGHRRAVAQADQAARTVHESDRARARGPALACRLRVCIFCLCAGRRGRGGHRRKWRRRRCGGGHTRARYGGRGASRARMG